MEITEVKTILQEKTTKQDEYLATMIPHVIEFAKEYCNNKFLDANKQEALPGGVRIFVAKACEFNMNKSGLKGRSMGDVSYSYETDFPPSLLKWLKPYRKVRFV